MHEENKKRIQILREKTLGKKLLRKQRCKWDDNMTVKTTGLNSFKKGPTVGSCDEC